MVEVVVGKVIGYREGNGEVGRGWGDLQVIDCLKETITCVVAKPLVPIIVQENYLLSNEGS